LHDDKSKAAGKLSTKEEESPYHPEVFAFIGILWGVLFIGFLLDVYLGVGFIVHMIMFVLVVFVWIFIIGVIGYILYTWKRANTNTATSSSLDHDL
jgi:cbb3-type cytochrome oxidase subunit 3